MRDCFARANWKKSIYCSQNSFTWNVSATKGKTLAEITKFEGNQTFIPTDPDVIIKDIMCIINQPVFLADIITPIENNEHGIKSIISTHSICVTRDSRTQSACRLLAASFVRHYVAKNGRACHLYYYGDIQYLEEHTVTQLSLLLSILTEELVMFIGILADHKGIDVVEQMKKKFGFDKGSNMEGNIVIIKESPLE